MRRGRRQITRHWQKSVEKSGDLGRCEWRSIKAGQRAVRPRPILPLVEKTVRKINLKKKKKKKRAPRISVAVVWVASFFFFIHICLLSVVHFPLSHTLFISCSFAYLFQSISSKCLPSSLSQSTPSGFLPVLWFPLCPMRPLRSVQSSTVRDRIQTDCSYSSA